MSVTGQPGRERVVAIVTPDPIARGLGRLAGSSVFAELHEHDLDELERRLRTQKTAAVGMVDFWVK
jgi:23S rRNA A2030 N6-methylase RlmJ